MGFKDAFCRQHSRLHCVVGAFYFGHVEEASRAARQHAAWESQLGNCVVAAFVQDSGAVADALTALQVLSDILVSLKSLEFFIGVEVGIFIVQSHDHA